MGEGGYGQVSFRGWVRVRVCVCVWGGGGFRCMGHNNCLPEHTESNMQLGRTVHMGVRGGAWWAGACAVCWAWCEM